MLTHSYVMYPPTRPKATKTSTTSHQYQDYFKHHFLPFRLPTVDSTARVARGAVNARLRLFPSGFVFDFPAVPALRSPTGFLRCPFRSTPDPVPTGSGCFREWTANLRSGSSPPIFGGSLPSASLVPPSFGRRRRWLASPCVRSALASGLAFLSGRGFAGLSVLSCPAGVVRHPVPFFPPVPVLPCCDSRLLLFTPSGLMDRTCGPVLSYARLIKQDAESLDADSLRSAASCLFAINREPLSGRRLPPSGDNSDSLCLIRNTLVLIV